MEETKGIIMFNRGTGCIVRAIVCMHTLRQHWDGPVTFYIEDTPKEFEDVCHHFHVDIIHNEFKPEYKTLTRKTDMFTKSPYDKTLWLDADMVVVGKLDEMFDYLDEADVAIPHFANWWSNGPKLSKRIKDFRGIAKDKHIDEALKNHPAINTGILSWKKSDKWTRFATEWVELADKGRFFISDEKAFQVLYPSANEWGLNVHIAPTKFNVSVLHDGGATKDVRVWHFHGKKHVLHHPNCDIWKGVFEEMRKDNVANINSFLKYADKRLVKYLNGNQDVTVVTACDEKYVEFLRETYPNWVKYKKIDQYPMIVFVNGMDLKDERLDFLRSSHVQLIPWSMHNADSHREEMLSAFVFGSAKHVKTDYWLKIDADSYATDFKPIVTDDMKKFAFCGHKWGYSRPDHIKALDAWAKGHWKRKLKNAPPMMEEGKEEGRRFYHNTKRTISFIQLHKTRFTKFCVGLLREEKLPAPTQDTFMFYVANRFDPETVGTKNFKKDHGFAQGNGKRGVESIRERLKDVEIAHGFAQSNDGPIVKSKPFITSFIHPTTPDESKVTIRRIED